MARRQTLQLDLELPEEPPMPAPEEPTPMRRRARPAPEPRRTWRQRARLILYALGGVALLMAALVAVYQLDEFLARDAHFVLAASALRVEGAVHASREAVRRVFAEDVGRSVYLMPLGLRRRALLAIDWVQRATVSRRWPNQVLVRLVERSPVAFAVLPGEPLALIDGEGVILSWPSRGQLELPVLRGITRQQPPPVRAQRVRQVLELLRQVRPYAGQISEIDVGDPENLVLTQTVEGRVVRLWLGNGNYLPRMKNFLNHHAEIGRRLPGAHVFDLRLDDRITVRPDAGEGAHGR